MLVGDFEECEPERASLTQTFGRLEVVFKRRKCMMTFGLKKWLIVLVAFFGLASMGSAQNIGAGFHWGNGLGGHLVINLSKGLALRGNLDLSLGNYSTVDFGANFGVDFSLNFRIPLVGDGTELYFGPGLVLSGGSGGGSIQFGLMALLGFELQLSKGVAFFAEFQPLRLIFTPRVAFGLDSFVTRIGLTFYF
jgi:hypothetical protein